MSGIHSDPDSLKYKRIYEVSHGPNTFTNTESRLVLRRSGGRDSLEPLWGVVRDLERGNIFPSRGVESLVTHTLSFSDVPGQ